MAGYNQRNAKVDANQPEIVKALRKIGAKVKLVHQLKNLFDILVGYNGKLFIVEIKNDKYLPKIYESESPKGKRTRLVKMLSDGERKCLEDFKLVGIYYHIVTSPKEAIDMVIGDSK